MSKLEQFILPNGETVIIEVEDVKRTTGYKDVSASTNKVEREQNKHLKHTFAKIKPTVEALSSSLADLANDPDEVELSLGVKISADVGVIFASAGADATFNIKLKWKRAKEA